ncbi:MAG: CAP domain-containing protein [Minisyncoccia bacterium]
MINFSEQFEPKNSSKRTQTYSAIAFTLFLLAVIIIGQTNIFPNVSNFVSTKVSTLADVISSVLVFETNNFRALNNENRLVVSSLLTQAAQLKADDMARKGYFSHISPNGDEPWIWFDKIGYKYDYAGENLAVDFNESTDVTSAWINSAKHEANLLNTHFTEMGVGIAKGMYEGHVTNYVVQFFASPLTAKINTAEVNQKSIVPSVGNEPIILQFSAFTSPTVAVATRSTPSDGAILGAETQSKKLNQNTDNQMQTFVIALMAIIVLFLVVVMTKKRKFKKS